jgi:bacillithiol system protein YtxJ
MNWKPITTEAALDEILQVSAQHPVLIFKHSTRCSISATALGRVERQWNPAQAQDLQPYFLDLIAHRDLSNRVASFYGVAHESPQVLLIKDGKCVYDASHFDISFGEIVKKILVGQ